MGCDDSGKGKKKYRGMKPIGEKSVFSLNFSLAGKGPFLTGKAKNMCQRRTLLPGEGLCVHEGFYFRASCQPIDRKVF